MAEERRVIRLAGPVCTRVRYGRATLTIARSGLLLGDLSAIAAYMRDELTADELAERFAEGRVRAHSPSFSWEDADRRRVLDLVIDASENPRFTTSDPNHVADRLVVAAGDQLEAMKRRMETFNVNVSAYLAKAFGNSTIPRINLPQLVKAGGLQADVLNKVSALSSNNILSSAMKALSGLNLTAINPKLFETAAWTRSLPDPAPWVQQIQAQLRSSANAMKEALPANWRELELEDLEQVIDLMKADGLSLAWAPREGIIRELIAAETHNDRCEILVNRGDEIIEDVEGVLRQIERADLQSVADAGFEAIRTYRDGHPGPAQTYAAAAVGEVLHGPLGYEAFGQVQRTFRAKDPVHDVGFREFPFFAVGHALARTLDRFKDAGDGFNRNLTQHRIGSHHSEPNLLMVLLLLAGLLPEVERLLDRGDEREVADAA